ELRSGAASRVANGLPPEVAHRASRFKSARVAPFHTVGPHFRSCRPSGAVGFVYYSFSTEMAHLRCSEKSAKYPEEVDCGHSRGLIPSGLWVVQGVSSLSLHVWRRLHTIESPRWETETGDWRP